MDLFHLVLNVIGLSKSLQVRKIQSDPVVKKVVQIILDSHMTTSFSIKCMLTYIYWYNTVAYSLNYQRKSRVLKPQACFSAGNISPYMISYLKNRTSEHTLNNEDNIWIMNAATILAPFSMSLGGVLDKKFGVKVTCAIGCFLFA